MKLHPDKLKGLVITGLGPGWIAVNGEKQFNSLVLDSQAACTPWPIQGFTDLGAAAFAPLALLRPELLLFGSGTQLRFPHPSWLQAFIEHGIGWETMDTAAACRTYNILTSEGRHVVAALILETP